MRLKCLSNDRLTHQEDVKVKPVQVLISEVFFEHIDQPVWTHFNTHANHNSCRLCLDGFNTAVVFYFKFVFLISGTAPN